MKTTWSNKGIVLALGLFISFVTLFSASLRAQARPERLFIQPTSWWPSSTLLVVVGDSLCQGVRDATVNRYSTENAFVQKIAQKLEKVMWLKFAQPFLDEDQNRINPLTVPTNLGVDGEDIFSVDGWEYGKRVGSSTNYLSDEYFCDRLQPYLFADMHDKVLYPINLLALKKVTQLDSLIWWLKNHNGPAWVVLWVGNNDAALATLGLGGANPMFLPIPYDQIKDKLKPVISYLLNYGRSKGVLAFDPYTPTNITRNLTETSDFSAQFFNVISKIPLNRANTYYFFLNYPYYCEVGYLMDSSDINFYLNKLGDPPQTLIGRISLLTFMCMYALAKSGETGRISQILADGGLILDNGEISTIKSRIDSFNSQFNSLSGSNIKIVDMAGKLNAAFKNGLDVNGQLLTRNWGRGNSFSFDGVHANHTIHAHIANIVLEEMKKINSNISTYNLASIMSSDPYIDRDGDGWMKGPDYKASGRTKILFLFKDYQEGVPGPAVIDTMSPSEVWELISEALWEEILSIPLIRVEAQRIGFLPVKD